MSQRSWLRQPDLGQCRRVDVLATGDRLKREGSLKRSAKGEAQHG
jgi:hypothetical protein